MSTVTGAGGESDMSEDEAFVFASLIALGPGGFAVPEVQTAMKKIEKDRMRALLSRIRGLES